MRERRLKLVKVDHESWCFEHPELVSPFDDQLQASLRFMERGEYGQAEKILRSITDSCSEHMSALNNLGVVLDYQQRSEDALRIWKHAVEVGLRCFPPDFAFGRHRVEWYLAENRRFLSSYHGLGLAYFKKNDFSKAFAVFNNILLLNPSDNQGVRYLLIECSFALKSPQEVLSLCNKYADDVGEEILFGRALALYQTGENLTAAQALIEAMAEYPRVAEMLVKKRNRKPDGKSDIVSSLKYGEAYRYWERSGKYWRETDGAVDFAKKQMSSGR
jgi:tetratricopeptide (TPR) repeat protein